MASKLQGGSSAGRYYVYLYRDPASGEPVYVGKGQGRRSREHLSNSSSPRLSNLIAARGKEGLVVEPEVVAVCEAEGSAFLVEQALIKFFGRQDQGTGPLFNLTDGGEGVSNPPVEVREAQADAMYRRFGGKHQYTWVLAGTSERFTGTRVDFAKFLNVPQSAVGKLFQGKTKSIGGWKLESDDRAPNLYRSSHELIHHFSGETFCGTQKEFADRTGISLSSISMLVTGKISHTHGWILRGNEKAVAGLRINSKGHYYTPKEPWESAAATPNSLAAWALADKLRDAWEGLSHKQRGSVGAKRLCAAAGVDYSISTRTFDKITKKIKSENFDPKSHEPWLRFKAISTGSANED